MQLCEGLTCSVNSLDRYSFQFLQFRHPRSRLGFWLVSISFHFLSNTSSFSWSINNFQISVISLRARILSLNISFDKFFSGHNGPWLPGKFIIIHPCSLRRSPFVYCTLPCSALEVCTYSSDLISGSMIAFLSQYSNFSTPLIAGLRAIAVIIGIGATFLSPPLIRYIGPIRSGIWFLSWQTILLIPVVIATFLPLSHTLQGALLVTFVSISRLGLWGFDLSEQYLVQQEIDATSRGEFSTTEAALQNTFDLLQFISTIIFARPEIFKWPVLMSCVSVGVALGVYALFVRKRRGHLVHIYEKILDREGCMRQ